MTDEESSVAETEEEISITIPKKRIKRSFVAIVILFFLILFGYSYVYVDSKSNSKRDAELLKTSIALSKTTAELSKENADRIKDIQASRTSSCRRTYSGIKEVFKPFIPAHPTSQRQIELIAAFNDNIERLKKGCLHQTDPNDPDKIKGDG